ncbi:MAG: CRTAC1 family protein, partial [Terriglobales bacterium]
RSGMGVDSGDYDQDGWMDLYVANIDHQRFALYRNDHDLTFTDVSGRSGIGSPTELLSGWGCRFFDYDNDSNLDLIQGDGHPDDMVQSYDLDVYYHEKPLLFHSNGHGGFTDVSAQAGPAFQRRWGTRGLAIGDYDNDGRIDVLMNNNGAAPLLLHNQSGASGPRNHWLGVLLVSEDCNRDAVCARVRWGFAGQRRGRLKTGGGSFLSAHDPRLVLGIGTAEQVDWLEIRWPQPSGRVERFTHLPLDRYITIVEGRGIQ